MTCQYFPCVHDVIKAFRAETSVQSLIPHFQLCPLRAHRTMSESGISGFANAIFHIKVSSQFTPVLKVTGTPQRSARTRVFTVLPGFDEFLRLEIFSLAVIRTTSLRLLLFLMTFFSIASRVNEPRVQQFGCQIYRLTCNILIASDLCLRNSPDVEVSGMKSVPMPGIVRPIFETIYRPEQLVGASRLNAETIRPSLIAPAPFYRC